MHNLSDDELDRLSREAAEQHRIPAESSSWEKIVARLDVEMPSGTGFNYHVIPDLALLLLLFLGLPVFYSAPGKQPAIHIQQNSKTETAKEAGSLIVSENKSSGKSVPLDQQEEKKTAETKASEQTDVVKVQPEETPTFSTPAGKPTGSKTGGTITKTDTRRSTEDQPSGISSVRRAESSGKNFAPVIAVQQGQADVPGFKNSRTNSGGWEIATLDGIDRSHKAYLITGPSVLTAPDVFPETATAAKTSETQSTAAAKKKRINDPASQRVNPLEFGLTWGPDFSTVGSAPAGDVGNIYGFVASYNFNRRWSVNTGILYSNKNYTAMGDEYQKIPGYDPADPDIKIKQVNAECLMWDLPVNVRYNWYWRPKQRAFASTGLSSYFMKEEDLKYWYTYYNNPKYKEWKNTKSSSYWAAVLNLSAGFEQQLFQGMTVQAEPFLKLSLREVGYGKVNLKSWGIFLGLKYIPPIHRIKK